MLIQLYTEYIFQSHFGYTLMMFNQLISLKKTIQFVILNYDFQKLAL
jgi:hypothetical protein